MENNRELVRFNEDILYAWIKKGNNALIEAVHRKDRNNEDAAIIVLKPLRGEILSGQHLFDIDGDYLRDAAYQKDDGNFYVEKVDVLDDL